MNTAWPVLAYSLLLTTTVDPVFTAAVLSWSGGGSAATVLITEVILSAYPSSSLTGFYSED